MGAVLGLTTTRFTTKLEIVCMTLLLTGVLTVAHAQTLEVTPNQILCDETPAIRAVGLQPGERIRLHAELIDGAAHRWVSEAEFTADARGTVDTSINAPLEGSYKEASAAGLIWSMKPTEKHVATYQTPLELGPQVIQFRLLRNSKEILTSEITQLMIAQGVKEVKVGGQLHGVLFIPKTDEPRPGILVLGGSEGGIPLQKAAWLASRGFVSFALAYFRYENLPSNLEGIPLEYFGRALRWMMERPEILPDRIGVLGTSRGGELALQLGAVYSQIKAVAAYVPANTRHPACCGNVGVPYAWTWKEQALPYVPPRFKHSPEDEMNSAIEVERIQGPILLVSGEDDRIWPSATMADAIVARLKQAHFRHEVEHLKYEGAGHRAGRPEISPAWHGSVIHPISGRKEDLGGTASGDALSSLDAIPKVLLFLQNSLGPSTTAGQ